MADDFKESALEYHRSAPAGKIQVVPTKPLSTQRDLALAYTPGVAEACRLIVSDPLEVSNMTSRGNLVAVITNGTAVLGLGDIGPLASKPVMEGKGVLFKKFAGVDVFDIEIAERDPDKLIEIIASLEPTFGGINLEDIKSPECFVIEKTLTERLNIPVFHDDQHGTAIIAAAATINGLKILGKDISDITLAVSGAGAAAIACVDLMIKLGMKPENIMMCDSKGVIRKDRSDLPSHKAKYATARDLNTLADAMVGTDMFLGVSAPGVLTGEMVKQMAPKPLILALANPVPEILPDEVTEVRDDAVIATGRSDFPNQVNNVLCFPYIFRGALDVGATCINEEMKVACVYAIAKLAQQEGSEEAAAAYGGQAHVFGADYIIPKPFDPRLMALVAPAVARAAMDSGVATRPIEDMEAYEHKLHEFVFRTGMLMKPVFEAAKMAKKRIVYADGEEESVLRAIQIVVDDQLVHPVIIGRPDVIQMRIDRLGLRFKLGEDVEVVNPQSDPRYREYWTLYQRIMARRGVTPELARRVIRTDTTVIASLMLKRNEVDGVICGLVGRFEEHLRNTLDVVGMRDPHRHASAMNIVILPKGSFFFLDTHVNEEPTAEEIAEATIEAAETIEKFGVTPRAALISHSNFGSADTESSCRLREALALIRARNPSLEVDGEMQMDAALSESRRNILLPDSTLKGEANLLVFPSLDAANSAYNLIRVLGDGVAVGPILLGMKQPVHILTPTSSVRGIVNVSALAAMEAQSLDQN